MKPIGVWVYLKSVIMGELSNKLEHIHHLEDQVNFKGKGIDIS